MHVRKPGTGCLSMIVIALVVASTELRSAVGPSALREFQAEYLIANDTVRAGTLSSSLAKVDRGWRFGYRSRPSGLLALYGAASVDATTVLEEHDGRLRPLRHRYRDQDSSRKRHLDLRFDWERNTVTVERRDQTVTLVLANVLYDETSVPLAVGLALSQGFDELRLRVLAGTRIRSMTFRNEGSETIDVPYGTFDAIKVREVRARGKRYTTSWFVPELNFVPARMEQYNNDTLVARTLLTSLTRR